MTTLSSMPLELKLYLFSISLSFVISALLTPIVRYFGVHYGFLDRAHAGIKTHKVPTPSLGGIAVFSALAATLLLIRYFTHFPTGTLYNLRAILFGAALIFGVGLVDDFKKPEGLTWKFKMAAQVVAAVVLVYNDLRIQFIKPDYLAAAISVFWIVGITNAINIIDIIDGLAATQIMVASLGFLLVAMPSESIYVNFAAAALFGSAAGFLPYNLSNRCKIFLGDAGALAAGFVLAALSLGTQYTKVNPLGVYAPLFILAIPIYDTLFVMLMRGMRGVSPFLGSRDHFALRLEAIGFSRHQIVGLCAIAGAALSFFAFLGTQVGLIWGIWIYIFVGGEFLLLSTMIAKVKMH